MKEKRRKHIIIYWFFMIALFIAVLLLQQLVASILQGSLSTAKYGMEATFEILWAGLTLILVLLFKNKYIFTQKREGFFASIKYILPELILSCFFFFIGLISIFSTDNPVDVFAIFNLLLYSAFIGIVEEFLCRGWLLNEFLERYSKNRKEILLSILFSSIIFGFVHFINIGEAQNFIETVIQVMNATAGGIFLALVYYKTKNIWVVVFSHAVWDFTIFLGDVNSLGDCLSGSYQTFGFVVNIIRGILLIVAYLFFSYWLYRKTDLYEKENKQKKNYYVAIGVALYILGLFTSVPEEGSLCPNYTFKNIEGGFQTTYYKTLSYNVSNYPLTLYQEAETGRIIFRNVMGESIYLTEDDDYYQYELIDNDDYYSILILSNYHVFYYGNYSKSDITNDREYLEKVKDSLVKMVGPNISSLGMIKIDNDFYHYPMLLTEQGDYLYFDKEGSLYLHSE